MWFFLLFVPYLNKITFADLANKEKLCRRNGLQSPNDRYGNVLSRQISNGLPYGYMIHMGKYVFRLIMCVIQRKILSRTLDIRIPYRDLDFFFFVHAGDKTENNFLYFFTELKTSHLSYSIYKHDANDIAYPSSNHRMRVIYELRNGPCSPSTLCGSAEENRSAKSDGLKSDSSWGLRIVSLSHAREKTKNIFLYFFTELKTIYLSYSIYDTHSLHLAGSYGVLRF